MKPPYLLSLCLALLLACPLSGNTKSVSDTTKHELAIGISGAFFGAGDLTGPAVLATYNYMISPYLSISPAIRAGYGHREFHLSYERLSSVAASLSLRLKPLARTFDRFYLEAGGLYHFQRHSFGSVDQNIRGIKVRTPFSSEQENLFGFIGTLGLDIIQLPQMDIGSRLDLLTSLHGTYLQADSWQLGIYIKKNF